MGGWSALRALGRGTGAVHWAGLRFGFWRGCSVLWLGAGAGIGMVGH